MVRPVLYSTNPWYSYIICNRYRGRKHVVWCSEVFCTKGLATTDFASAVGPTSTPRSIAERLHEESNKDRHSDLIRNYKKKFSWLTSLWEGEGSLSSEQAMEIRGMLKTNTCNIWRPMIYVIPREPIERANRLNHVPPSKRAGSGPEYQVFDLEEHEFDIWEWKNA